MPRQRQIRLEGPARVTVEAGDVRVTANVSNAIAQAILKLIAAPEPAPGDDPAFAEYVAGEVQAASEKLK